MHLDHHRPGDIRCVRHDFFYDLRATGITWCAVRGDDPLKIKQRVVSAQLLEVTAKPIVEAPGIEL